MPQLLHKHEKVNKIVPTHNCPSPTSLRIYIYSDELNVSHTERDCILLLQQISFPLKIYMLITGFSLLISLKISAISVALKFQKIRDFRHFLDWFFFLKKLTQFDWIWINFYQIKKKREKLENFGWENDWPGGSKIMKLFLKFWIEISFTG